MPIRDRVTIVDDEPTVGRHRLAESPPTWNSSTMIVQVIRDSLAESGVRPAPPPRLAEGPAPELPRRPLDLGKGLRR